MDLPQPDYRAISNKFNGLGQECTELGNQFLRFQNIPAVVGGDAILATLNLMREDIATLKLLREDIATLKQDVATLKQDTNTGFEELRSDVRQMKTDIRQMKTDIQELKTDVRQLKTDVQELKTDVRQLKTDVQELKTDVRQLKTDVQELKTDVRQLKTDVQELKTHTTSLEALMETRESNNVARLWNGLSTKLRLPIQPLWSPITHEVPADFPETREQFDTLNKPKVTELLRLLGQPVEGSMEDRLQRLKIISGLTPQSVF
ncbi:hypothetical protein F4859DRAFT_49455 [Xylaria cf. heliscus]|nr:hypothetical protein F4859DRAFT_49455 [Xylaria cf. heliscus]